jgi:hypothetical protein
VTPKNSHHPAPYALPCAHPGVICLTLVINHLPGGNYGSKAADVVINITDAI